MELLQSYEPIVGHEIIDQLRQLALPLKDIKVVHVNSTRLGGGVAEILHKLIPLTENLGIKVSWEVVTGDQDFFQCTKSFHNALQGNKVMVQDSLIKGFEATNAVNSEKLKTLEDADIVFIHDPQPLPLITHFPNRKGKWVWRCHIDASKPYRPIWKYLSKYINKYDACVFSLADFAHPLSVPMYLIPPSIDPLSEKNIEIQESEINQIRETFELDPARPLILQVSRFDYFKDPVGVIEAYRLVKDFIPDLQLVLAGGSATDDPEGDLVLKEVLAAAGSDPDIHILLLPPDAHRTINALQRAADIVIQKSTKEGFGLTVTEALWKGKPVIGGNTGGIRLQVIDYLTGFLVNTPEGAALRIRYLFQNGNVIKEMGNRAKQFIKEKFLITRHLHEYLILMTSLHFGKTDRLVIGDSEHPM